MVNLTFLEGDGWLPVIVLNLPVVCVFCRVPMILRRLCGCLIASMMCMCVSLQARVEAELVANDAVSDTLDFSRFGQGWLVGKW